MSLAHAVLIRIRVVGVRCQHGAAVFGVVAGQVRFLGVSRRWLPAAQFLAVQIMRKMPVMEKALWRARMAAAEALRLQFIHRVRRSQTNPS